MQERLEGYDNSNLKRELNLPEELLVELRSIYTKTYDLVSNSKRNKPSNEVWSELMGFIELSLAGDRQSSLPLFLYKSRLQAKFGLSGIRLMMNIERGLQTKNEPDLVATMGEYFIVHLSETDEKYAFIGVCAVDVKGIIQAYGMDPNKML